MTRVEILNGIRTLAGSQGCWGRLLRDFAECPETEDMFFAEFPPENYTDFVDFIMDLEG